MECLSCHADNSDSARFCTQCGAALPTKCTNCGVISPPRSKFCGGCGTNLAGPPPTSTGAATAMQKSSSFVEAPARIAGGERRHLTVLFCDIVGSTSLARLLDPEDLNEITRRYYDCCTDAIAQFDGLVANYIGDGVMALFGYPRAHEDDAERAIRAALTIVRTMRAANSESERRVRVRVGIATGLVVVGEDGAQPLTKEKTVVGETPNLAAHLQSAAEPDHVLISEATRRLIGDVFELEEWKLDRLKSAKEPLRAWRVVREKRATSRFAAHVANLTNFVGRDQEVALLTDRWREAVQSEGQVVVLSGEAGIGKSRIIETFCRRISERPHIVFYQCSPYHVDSALHPIIKQLEHAAGLGADDSPKLKLAKLETLLRQVATPLQDVVPLFAALLSIPTGDCYPPPDPDPQRRKERTLNALVDQFARLVEANPAVIVLEDAHWADPTTLDLFSRTIMRIPKLRVLLLVTCRPEFKARWMGHSQVTTLILSRLTHQHCRTMVESIASSTLPTAIMEQIIAKTDGIPLFVEELTKTVLESGLLQDKGGTWQLSGPLPSLAIPATLQDSLMARLDRLSSVREVAQTAATIGREFPYALLAAVCSMPETELEDALAKLVGAELIFPRAAPPAASYIFKHALVRDAAYETLLRSKRNQLHGKIAKVLETRFPEVAETQPEILAHHYTHASLTETAVEWWRKAGDLAIKRSANREAATHLGRAIELVALLPETRERDASELAIRIRISGPLIATGGYVTSELTENYSRAWQLCTKLADDKHAFPVMYGQWVIPYVRGDMAAALENSERFLRRAEQQEDDGLLLMGHRIYGSSLVWRGNTLQGCEHLQRALSLYRPEHDQLAYVFSQHPRTAALAHLCLGLQHLGHLDQAMAAGWEAITQAKRIEHFNSIAYSLCFVSLLIMLRLDVDTLKRTAGELLKLAEQNNAAYWAKWAKPMLGWIRAQEGDIKAGIQDMHQSTAELKEQGANLWVPQTLLLEAEILGRAGQVQDADRLLDEAQALIEPLDQRFYEAELYRVRGMVALWAGGGFDVVSANFDRAIDVARQQNSRFLELRATMSKARLYLKRGMREPARKLLTPIYQSFSEGLGTTDLVEARTFLCEVTQQGGQGLADQEVIS
jgi:class 3 adenylate cyclase/predicted ATPase